MSEYKEVLNSRNGGRFDFTNKILLTRLESHIKSITENEIEAGTIIYYINPITGFTDFIDGEIKPYGFFYRTNEELDAMNVNFISEKLTSKIPNLTKIKVVHHATLTDYLPRYDDNGKPVNHDDYVIASGSCNIAGGEQIYYEHNYEFVEPIYLLKYWATETQTVTNMTSITVSELNADGEWEQKTYIQEETNLYYVVDRMLKITGYRTSVEDCSLSTLIKIMDKELLKEKCKGINDNFMASNAYANLFKVGKYINRLPVLYFNYNYDVQDSSSILNEDKKEYLLFFETKTNSNIIKMENFFDEIYGYSEIELSQRDAGTIVIDAQNMISTEAVWYPAKDCYCAPRAEKGEYAITSSTKKFFFLPAPIKKIIKVLVKIYQANILQDFESLKDGIKILEYKEWFLLTPSQKKKYLYYIEGENKIYYSHYEAFLSSVGDKELYDGINGYYVLFSVLYEPYLNMRLKTIEKNLNETSITQTDATLDSKAYGDYLRSYIKENGNIDYTVIKKYDSYFEIEKIGTKILMNDGTMLVISSIDVTRKNNEYYVIYGLNKNFIKRSFNITASQNIDNKIINKEASQNRYISIKENVTLNFTNIFNESIEEYKYNYISYNNPLVMNYCNNIDLKVIDSIELDAYKNEIITYVQIEFPEIAFTKFSFDLHPDVYFCINTNRTLCGNSIIYNFGFNDNMMIIGGGAISNNDMSDGNDVYNIYYRYTDIFGKTKDVSCALGEMQMLSEDVGTYNKEYVEFVKTYPSIESNKYIDKYKVCSISFDDLLIYKDTNEILNLNFQINFLSKNEMLQISSKFIEQNALLKSEKIEKDLYIVLIPTGAYNDDVESSINKINGYFSKVSGNYENGTITYTLENTLNHQKNQQIALAVLKNDSEFDILLLLDTCESLGNIDKMYLEFQ